MSSLYITVLIASLVGSLHCLAMCGPLVGMAAGRYSWRASALHALGRLATYTTLGVAAGAAGKALDLAGQLVAVQRGAAIVAALAIVAWGAFAIGTARGWWRVRSRADGRLFRRGLVQLRTRRPGVRAYVMGLLSGLIPCGWLWAFVVSAAGTGSALAGGLVMIVFWVGTLPAMTGALALLGPVVERIRARMPVLTALALITLGLGIIAARWDNAGADAIERPSCHARK